MITSNNNSLRPAYLEIDLDALAFNVRSIKKKLGKGVKMLAVVKADGYGHGAYAVSRVVLENGADSLGVAIVEEGVELREKGIVICLIDEFLRGQEEADNASLIDELIKRRIKRHRGKNPLEVKQRLFYFLRNRGFSFSQITAALERVDYESR